MDDPQTVSRDGSGSRSQVHLVSVEVPVIHPEGWEPSLNDVLREDYNIPASER